MSHNPVIPSYRTAINVINEGGLTALRVCEDALRRKMILLCGKEGGEEGRGIGGRFWTLRGSKLESQPRLVGSAGSPSQPTRSFPVVMSMSAAARRPGILCPRPPRSLARSRLFEERRRNYVVCCVKPVPKFLRAHSVTAGRDKGLVILARNEPSLLPITWKKGGGGVGRGEIRNQREKNPKNTRSG